MAIHASLASMLHESLPEYLRVAEYFVRFSKGKSWPAHERGGCLGYPAAAMLFSITDAIGSYHRRDSSFRATVEGTPTAIQTDGFQHFYVLNAGYYCQNLSSKAIRALYANFRNPLLHNAAIPPGNWLVKSAGDRPFPERQGRQCVDLAAFLKVSRQAVRLFLGRVHALVPASAQAKVIERKR